LREILLAGLDGIVHFGKTFERFEQAVTGQVRAYFADGTSSTGDLLVGADGTTSAVRPLVVPEAQIDDLHDMMYGKTPLTTDMLGWLPAVLVDTFNNVIGPDGVKMGVATCRPWASVAEATAQFVPGLHLTDVPYYLSWTLSLTADYRAADGPTLHQLAQRLLRPWHPAVRRIVDAADVPATFPIIVQSARPVDAWHTPHVTLLGDAIHTMSPGRGEAAHTALRDAALLYHKPVEVVTKGVPLAHAKAQYEAEMLRYGFEAVAMSRQHPFVFRAVRDQARSETDPAGS
jgi:2-polyprenyl-6-methoxyphenol hydroxylase-like FAD-dependent oxidoreductase